MFPSIPSILGTTKYEKETTPDAFEAGTFNRFDLKSKIYVKLLDNISISNGMAWNEKISKFYYIDSMSHSIDEFDYDITTGNIRKRITIIFIVGLLIIHITY